MLTFANFPERSGVKSFKSYVLALQRLLAEMKVDYDDDTFDLGVFARDRAVDVHRLVTTVPYPEGLSRINDTYAAVKKCYEVSFPGEPVPLAIKSIGMQVRALAKLRDQQKAEDLGKPVSFLVADIVWQAEQLLHYDPTEVLLQTTGYDPEARTVTEPKRNNGGQGTSLTVRHPFTELDRKRLILLWLAIAPGLRAWWVRAKLVESTPDEVPKGEVVVAVSPDKVVFKCFALKRGDHPFSLDTDELKTLYPESAHLVPDFVRLANRLHTDSARDGTVFFFQKTTGEALSSASEFIGATMGHTSDNTLIGQNHLRQAAVYDDALLDATINKDNRVEIQTQLARRLEIRNHSDEVKDEEYLHVGVPEDAEVRRRNFAAPNWRPYVGLKQARAARKRAREEVADYQSPESDVEEPEPVNDEPPAKRLKLLGTMLGRIKTIQAELDHMTKGLEDFFGDEPAQ